MSMLWSLSNGLYDSGDTNSTTTPTWEGYAGSAVAVVFFGSNFAPVKKFETGDGIFFQWVLCSAIWLTGLCIHAIRNFPKFYPLAMLGGFLWSTGNVMVVPIIHTIGLAQGLLIWASTNLLAGWASGRFGWFGLDPEPPKSDLLNYIGVSMCVISAFIYVFIRSETQNERSEHHGILGTDASDSDDDSPLLDHGATIVSTTEQVTIVSDGQVFYQRWSPLSRRIFGTVLAVISGFLYGLAFTPVIYMQNRQKATGISQNGLDFVFAHWCGIYATSSAIFLVYCIYMRNRPRIYPQAILPGFLSGVMWAIADAAWFVANSALSEAVAFPIITTGPGVIAALWGVFVFKEIRGMRNLLILLCAGSIAIGGTVITGLSKEISL